MYRRDSHGKTLQTFTVKPGSETGLYYILVANLAHKTTWKDLKAFASQACEVDHAEVYPPTSGFVRVRGRANFERAFQFLDGNTLEYRALQADARNSSQPTVVKLPPNDYHAASILRGEEGRLVPEDDEPAAEAAGGSSHPFAFVRGAVGSSGSEYQDSASPAFNVVHMDSWGYATPRSFLPDGYQSQAVTASNPRAYQTATPSPDLMLSATQPVPQGLIYSTYTGSMVSPPQSPPSAAFQFDSPTIYYATKTAYDVGHSPYAGFAQPLAAKPTYDTGTDLGYLTTHFSALALGTDTPQPYHQPQLEQQQQGRELLLLHLPRDCRSESAVLSLLARHTAAVTAEVVDKIRLPTNKSGRPRGAAYVTFASAETARAVAKALDGRDVGGGVRLRVRVVLGVDEGGNGNGHGGGGRSHQQQRSVGGSTGVGKGSGGGGGVSGRKGVRSTSSSSVFFWSAAELYGSGGGVVGPESVGEENKKTTTTTTREEPPVIVDGSGGRRKKEAAPVVVDGSVRKKGSGAEGQRSGRRC
ncbi:hypothetical protein VTJ49DRAFT_3259 [Mycothermus thermophilus]|uniref:RRM domain-containing protein n=1 Tax=Humicola insolens TaxID=85995 RepID=A0ABR3V7Z8_HUMIN